MNAEDGSEQYVMKLDHNPKSLSFLPDGRQVLLQLVFGAEIFDADSVAVLAALPDFGGRVVVSAGLSPDGDAIISSFTNNLVRLWDADTGKNEMLRLEHPGGKPVNSAEYSPDGHRIISGSRGGTVRIWDAETGALTAEKRASDADIAKVRFLGDGSGFLSVSRNGTIKLWQP
jgi:WD40 repeat protein